MLKRVISGIVIVIVFLGITFLPVAGMQVFFLMLSLVASYELLRTVRIKYEKVSVLVGLASIGASAVLLFLKVPSYLAFMLGLLYILLQPIFNKEQDLESIMAQIFVFSYLCFLFLPIISLENRVYVWLIYLLSWFTDTFAYFVGITIGKHKLCERISPKKSIEGAVGGSLIASCCGVLFCMYFQIPLNIGIILLILLATVMGQLGDLVASFVKRQIGVKDYGHLIPGHGGVMDRLDSMIFIVPVVYLIVNLIV